MERLTRVFLLVLALLLVWCNCLQAQSDEEYYARLAEMQKVVRAQKIQGLVSGGAGSPASALALLGLQRKFFYVGQTWTVQVTHKSDSRGRMPAPSASPLPEPTASPVLYDFKVLAVDGLKRARLEVRERANHAGIGGDHLILLVNEQFVAFRKELHYGDGRGVRVIELGGDANVALGFERFPVDLPDLGAMAAEPVRELPQALRPYLEATHGQILDFRFDDLFARPVRALWADGDVWPLYFESSAFTAILIGRGAAP